MSVRKPLEKDVQAAVRDWLTAWGAFVIRVNSAAFTGEYKGKKRFFKANDQPGCSDLLCVLPDGRFAAFECKRVGEKPGMRTSWTPHLIKQESFLAAVRQRGGVAGFVTSVEDVKELLRENGYPFVT